MLETALAFVIALSVHSILSPSLNEVGWALWGLWNTTKRHPVEPGEPTIRTNPSTSPALVTEPGPLERVPEGIVAYARSWGAEWAEADILERARGLYAVHGDWDVVYQELLQQDGETVNG